MKKLRSGALLLLVLALLLSAFVVSAQPEASTLRFGTTYMIDTLNPANGFYGYGIRPLWYDTLITWAGEDRYEPGLAESWSVSDDELTWTFIIREGVTFHDGMPLTAAEAAWNINWIIENEVPSLISYMTNIESAEAPDATTLLVYLSSPVPDMISAKFLFTWMLPPHIWADKSGDEITEFDTLEATIGSGPYRLTEYREGEFMIMEAYADYWAGPPPVDRLIYREYATPDALSQALIAGEIDLITTVPPSIIFALEAVDNVAVVFGAGFDIEELIINSSPKGTQPASLNDPVVRLAIAHAVDKQQIITIGLLGYAEPGTTVLPLAMGDFHNSDIVDIPFDLDEANRILDEAGFMDSNNDGIREYSDGTPLEYRLYAPDSASYYVRILEIIASDLAEIGIAAVPTILSDDSLIALQEDYDNDLIYWGWSFDPDPSFALSVFTCAETVPGGWSDSGYCNDEYDALFELQASTSDQEERRQIIWEMQQMLFDDLPYIVTAYPQSISAYRSDRFSFAPDLASAPLKWALFNGFAVLP